MHRYLLFDSGCTICSNLAHDVERHSKGRLSAQSLTDPKIQEWLKQARPDWQWEPTLLEVGEETRQAFTGVSMRARLLWVLGPRRSWQVARLVARSQGAPSLQGATRKDFLKQAGAAVAGITGLAAFGAAPAAAGEKARVTSIDDLPGSYARKEGVTAYSRGMASTGTAIHVEFTHANPAMSGTLVADEVSHARSSFHLVRDGGTVVQSVFDKENGWCDIEDNAGRKTHFVFTEDGVSPRSAAVVEENRDDLSIAAAIQNDLEMLLAPQKSELSGQARTQGCACRYGINIRGTGANSARSYACQDARGDANLKCSNCSCLGCCAWVSTKCDCACVFGDYLCNCGITGHPCDENCLPSCR